MGGACLKAPIKPSAVAQPISKSLLKWMPDPVDYPDQWIKAELDRIGAQSYWWKETRALKRFTIKRDLSKLKAFYFLWWQVAAFRLPLAQQEVSGWWDSPACFHGLHPQDFLPHADTGTRNFQTVRQ